jgi:hypothetical protein
VHTHDFGQAIQPVVLAGRAAGVTPERVFGMSSRNSSFRSAMTISITELGARAREIINEVVTKGTVVNVICDGRVMARIEPVGHGDSSSDAAVEE